MLSSLHPSCFFRTWNIFQVQHFSCARPFLDCGCYATVPCGLKQGLKVSKLLGNQSSERSGIFLFSLGFGRWLLKNHKRTLKTRSSEVQLSRALVGIHVCAWTIYKYGKALLISELFRKEVPLGSPHLSPLFLKYHWVMLNLLPSWKIPSQRSQKKEESPWTVKQTISKWVVLLLQAHDLVTGWKILESLERRDQSRGRLRIQMLLRPKGETFLSGSGVQLEAIWTWPFAKIMHVWMEVSDSDISLLSDSPLEDEAASWLCKALLDVQLCLNFPCFLPPHSSMPVCIWHRIQTQLQMYGIAAWFLGCCCKWQKIMNRTPKGSHAEERAEREISPLLFIFFLSLYFLCC